MSGRLLIVASESREFGGLLPHIEDMARVSSAVRWTREGRWHGSPVTLIANGVGQTQAAAAIRAFPDPAAIINIGFCGALDNGLNIGDVIVADKVFFSSLRFDCQQVSTSAKYISGPIYSSTRIVATADEKRQLRGSGALAVEMEAGGLAGYAKERHVPFFCVRAVSDLANESFVNDFNAALGADGQYRIGRLIWAAMLRPHSRVPELVRLKKRCDIAAERLGEFLDSCSF